MAAVHLATALRHHGFASDVLALTKGADDLGVEVLDQRAGLISSVLDLRRRLDRHDIVVAHGSRALPAVAGATAGTATRFLSLQIGDPRYWERSTLRRLRVGAYLKGASASVVFSDVARLWMLQAHRIPAERVVVIPNGRSADHFRVPSSKERQRARRLFGISTATRVVALVGALSVEKRPVEAAKAVLAQSNTTLIVAGDGPQSPALAALGREHLGRVVLLGAIDDVRPVLWASDAIVLASLTEGLPGVLIEAGMCGVPAAAVDVGFVSDIVTASTGTLAGALKELPQAVAAVLDRRQELGPAAREHCANRFEMEHVASNWCSVLMSVAKDQSESGNAEKAAGSLQAGGRENLGMAESS